MRVKFFDRPFAHFIFEEIFSDDDLLAIQNELSCLLKAGLLFDDDDGKGSAKTENLESKNSASNVWLDDLYQRNRYQSKIIASSEIFMKTDLAQAILNSADPYFSHYGRSCNHHGTMLNYYRNGSSYLPHSDTSQISIIFTFFQEPQVFSGGNIVFTDFGIEIESTNNSAVVFPGYIRHGISEVSIRGEDADNGLSRFGLAIFVNQK